MNPELPDIDVIMFNGALSQAPSVTLPPKYVVRAYQPGDDATWVRVQSTDPFFVPNADTFDGVLPGDTAYRSERIMFLVDPSGKEIGNITAWNTAEFTGDDIGQICWFALLPDARGRGLGAAMLSAACNSLRERGYERAFIDTNMRRIPALRLYRRFGFKPFFRNNEEEQAWGRIAAAVDAA